MKIPEVPVKLKSRKLLLTLAIIALVAVSNAMGSPLDEASLEAIVKIGLGLVGAQGAVDMAAAFSAGRSVAAAVEEEAE